MPTRRRHNFSAISDERYEQLLALQGGHCALCPNTPKTRRLHRDHDHGTLELRGLLCHSCNRRLWAGCTEEWLLRAVDYLRNPPAREPTSGGASQ